MREVDLQIDDVAFGGECIGRIHLDLHPREGKFKHAAQFTVRSGKRSVRLPEGALLAGMVQNPRKFDPSIPSHRVAAAGLAVGAAAVGGSGVGAGSGSGGGASSAPSSRAAAPWAISSMR